MLSSQFTKHGYIKTRYEYHNSMVTFSIEDTGVGIDKASVNRIMSRTYEGVKGAYSWGSYDSHPYVLLNYHGSLSDVFTLAHEMGHAIHSYYSHKNQPYVYAGYHIFVAEVASICNEMLLVQYLIGQAKDAEEKKYLINYLLEQFRTTLYRQTMFAEFEMKVHALKADGQTLTAQQLCEIYYDLQ